MRERGLELVEQLASRGHETPSPAAPRLRPTRRAWSAPSPPRGGRPSASAARCAGAAIRSRSVRSASCCGLQRHEDVVEVAPPLGRAALHQREVVGREHGDPQRPEQVAGPRSALAVDLHPVRPPAPSSASISSSRALALALGPHDRRRRTLADERVGRRAAERRRAWRGSRSPRAGWSCPARCHRRSR